VALKWLLSLPDWSFLLTSGGEGGQRQERFRLGVPPEEDVDGVAILVQLELVQLLVPQVLLLFLL
jgi:hypothetical protein